MTRDQRYIIGIAKYMVVFGAGGLIYAALELLWRGHTHWSMIITGGLCTVFLYLISVFSPEPLWKKWIMSGAVITTVEFLAGVIINILLGWNVWSYAHSRVNLCGQICLSFSLLWLLLSIPAVWLMRLVGRRIFKDGKGGTPT